MGVRTEGNCPDCGHGWRAHEGRHEGYTKCNYSAFGRRCHCTTMDPDEVAENERAAYLWNSFLGRGKTEITHARPVSVVQ